MAALVQSTAARSGGIPCSDDRFGHGISELGDEQAPHPGATTGTSTEAVYRLALSRGWAGVVDVSHYQCAAARALGLNDRKLYKSGIGKMEELRARGVNAVYIHFGEDGVKHSHITREEFEYNALVRQTLIQVKRIHEAGLFRRDDHSIAAVSVANIHRGSVPEGVLRLTAPLMHNDFALHVVWQLVKGMPSDRRPLLDVREGVSLEIREMIRDFGRKQPFYRIQELDW